LIQIGLIDKENEELQVNRVEVYKGFNFITDIIEIKLNKLLVT
jgi:hypothetical protein